MYTRAQSKEEGDSPFTHNPSPAATTSPADTGDFLSPAKKRKRRQKHLVHNVDYAGGSAGSDGTFTSSNPWHERSNEGGNSPYRSGDRPVSQAPDPGDYPQPSDKGWNDGYGLMPMAAKRGMSMSALRDELVIRAAKRGISVAQMLEEDTAAPDVTPEKPAGKVVTIPVEHVTKDLGEMLNFIEEDLKALQGAGEDMTSAMEHLQGLRGALK